MDTKTRNAIIGVDMNRMGEPTRQGASSRPVPKLHGPDLEAERTAAGDEIIRRAMARVAAEETEAKVEDRAALEARLMAQVAGNAD